MHVPKWLVTPFDMKIDNKGYESDLEDLLRCIWSLKLKRCSKVTTSLNIGAIPLLLLSSPSSEQQPKLS